MKTITTEKHYANYLTTTQAYALATASVPVVQALQPISYGVFHVGSSLRRKDWRDIDLRCIMSDEKFDDMFGKYWSPLHMLLNASISEIISARSGLPVDFQFQRATDCNKEFSSKEGHGRSAIAIDMIISWQKENA